MIFAAPAYHAPKGRVGPVYTFVKTDPKVMSLVVVVGTEMKYDKLGAVLSNGYYALSLHSKELLQSSSLKSLQQANFKWGVRHRAGAQYGRR